METSWSVHPRASELVGGLELLPHPEGGHFREIHRSGLMVDPEDARGARSALTSIYFLLVASEISRWHRVRSDEAWHFIEGDVAELHIATPDLANVSSVLLGSFDAGAQPVRTVVADCWQAAHTTGAYSLLACTVGPGFDFADFTMLRDMTLEAELLQTKHPYLACFI